jgi:single-stranded-DNA-specific exonuclease
MAGGKYQWLIADADRQASMALAKALDIPRLLAHLMLVRGVTDTEAGSQFLNPSRDQISDPMLLTDMGKAVARIAEARDRQEHVRVFGDYDVDGIAGTALLVGALRRYGLAHVSHAMPDRLTEGYGLNAGQVQRARDEGVALIVTVDNGVAAHDAADTARELGVDLIVTDHHNLPQELPDALAVINPKREAPDYPGRDLSGTAVAGKLAAALEGELHDLDLVALATVADMVPLHGENRALVALGLQQMRTNARPGIRQLAVVAGTKLPEIQSEQFSFQLAPRINAGGRLGNGQTGLKLLLSESDAEAAPYAKELDQANQERRAIEDEIVREAFEVLEADESTDRRSVVLARQGWHPGVIGIVASRVQSRYYHPAIMIALDEQGLGRGSARSVSDFDIAGAIGACDELLVRHGGHRAAAGLTIEAGKVEAFVKAFEAAVAQTITDEQRVRTLKVDATVSLSEVDGHFMKLLDRLQPVGHGNPAPVLSTNGVEIIPNSPRELRGGHVRFTVKDGPSAVTAIGFRMADRLPEILAAQHVDLAFTPQLNTWQGQTSTQLVLKDIAVETD